MLGRAETGCVVINGNVDIVANIVMNAVQTIRGYKIKAYDNVNRRILVSVSLSMFTWGEDLTITLTPVSENQTQVYISSSSKLGTEIASTSQNRENVNKVIQALYPYLR